MHAGNDGPVFRWLREVGVTGLAVGAFGEVSDDAHKLLSLVTTAGAAERCGAALWRRAPLTVCVWALSLGARRTAPVCVGLLLRP